MMLRYYGLLATLLVAADAFMPTTLYQTSHSSLMDRTITTASTITELQMAGFGASDGDKKKKDKVLKPKRQWNQYNAMKGSKSIPVAVRVVDSADWLEVGAVKSKDNANTEAAVIRHRVLIAEHSRRMFPVQVLSKSKLEWAYKDDNDDWVSVGKVEMPSGIDKLIGFEGLADPSGFYAHTTEKISDKTVASFGKTKGSVPGPGSV